MASDVKALPKPGTGRNRVIIENVRPQIDGGRFPAKRIIGDRVEVQADIFGDGHDHVAARLLYQKAGAPDWQVTPMVPLDNDRWSASFLVESLGRYRFTLVAGIDHFDTWRSGFEKKLAAGQDMSVELLNGAQLVDQAAKRARGAEATQLRKRAAALRQKPDIEVIEILPTTPSAAIEAALSPELAGAMARYPDTTLETRFARELEIHVDRERARFSSWYELFPRSTAPQPGAHGTFRDVEARLDYVQSLGFDVLYLPPIHPIGRSFRKGRNNTVTAEPEDVGSPWAIGATEGGHTDILPELGTLADFQHLRAAAESRGIELALDIAFQCAPDHPWVTKHPDWFKQRADGTIQYAENPPKKYQDIYPLDFESSDWQAMWDALRDVFLYWAGQGVRIFRVDNPHTKAFSFWEWVIASVQQQYPDALFLAEAFTRPRIMEQLAKLGFSQSYSYFCWRTTRPELETYGRELTQDPPDGTSQWE
ncbi:MAG TPA: maltotransferase domain-containing protein, partial [Acidobacteriaceae bacterium]